ncbi:2,3-bisphosphoglycerate-dependent phosphoglycerate mutase [Chlamydiia bacterium]|nr:2,3-bisphosphoglycerate-dependent phosphoglycerate mutase [Chlamydiia bacterium]
MKKKTALPTHTLILIRHGQSVWNHENRFTGWVDVPLHINGVNEARRLHSYIAEKEIHAVFCSALTRSLQTALVVLEGHKYSPLIMHEDKRYQTKLRDNQIPLFRSPQLNERHYGIYQGLIKRDVKDDVGDELFLNIRRGYETRPALGESLKDTQERVRDYIDTTIYPMIDQPKTYLIVAHGNSIRALIMDLCHLTKMDVQSLEIPTATPLELHYTGEKYQLIKPMV